MVTYAGLPFAAIATPSSVHKWNTRLTDRSCKTVNVNSAEQRSPWLSACNLVFTARRHGAVDVKIAGSFWREGGEDLDLGIRQCRKNNNPV